MTPTLAPSTAFSWPAGRRAAVSLSFDDARLSQIDVGIPILDRYNVKGTFYISPGSVEKRLDGWRKAVAAGHEIGNHTLTHPCSGNFAFVRQNGNPLEDYTLDRIERDILQANEVMRSVLGVTPTTFAYPCGQKFVGRGEQVQSYVPVVAKHFLVGRGAFDEDQNDPAFCDLAQAFAMDADGASFERLKVLVDKAVKEGGWLILLGHEIGEPGRQRIGAQTLDELCRYCLSSESGIWFDTVAAIGAHVNRARNQH